MIQASIGDVKVMTTSGRGHSPEEMAELAVEKIIYIGKDSHPAIIEQARAFRENIKQVLVDYFDKAQEQERNTIANKLTRHGYGHLSVLIRS